MPFFVDHVAPCVGYRIEQGGSTMVFAADSRPCQGVVEHAKGADLLIHEAYGTSGEAEAAHFGATPRRPTPVRSPARPGGPSRPLTHIRANRFADPGELVAEAGEVFGGTVEAARDLDAFAFWSIPVPLGQGRARMTDLLWHRHIPLHRHRRFDQAVGARCGGDASSPRPPRLILRKTIEGHGGHVFKTVGDVSARSSSRPQTRWRRHWRSNGSSLPKGGTGTSTLAGEDGPARRRRNRARR